MSVCHSKASVSDLPPEERHLEEVVVRLISPGERKRFDQLMNSEHYLGNGNAVGQVLRYVAEYRGQWVALLTFCSAALHLKPRDRMLGWTARQVRQRRHLIAQNSRFLILASTGRWPNLASKVLKQVCQALPQDWKTHFGHPVLLAETFVDPERFRGTCYRAAGWEALGSTKGYQRRGRDFYTDTQHAKELWVRPLGPKALKQLRAQNLPESLEATVPALPPPSPVATEQLDSLRDFVAARLKDPRHRKGVRHPLVSMVCIAMLAIGAGCQGPHAIAEFAQSLNHGQRRRLRCRPRRGHGRKFDVPCERTFVRLFNALDADQLCQIFVDWMAQLEPEAPWVVHIDGKVLKHTDPAPPRLMVDPDLSAAAAKIDTPEESQKPKAEKALTLVNFQTPDQQLLDQITVPSDTNEEAAVAAHLPKMELGGMTLIADAAHTVKANCLELIRHQGADYIFALKGNQPNAFAKAKQLLHENIPPSGPILGPRTRTD